MKNSIKQIFGNLKWYLFFVLFSSLLAVGLIFEHSLSFDKVDTLLEQKSIITTLANLDTHKDIDSALIEFNSKSTKLQQDMEMLYTLYKYNFTDHLILKNEKTYLQNLDKLSVLIKQFRQESNNYYNGLSKNTLSKQELHNSYTTMKTLANKITAEIEKIIFNNIHYNEEKYTLVKYLSIALFLLIFIATFWYKRTLNKVYQDIEYLHQVEKNKEYEVYTLEADAIALRMNRKNVIQEQNPNNIDQLTGINNYRGMLSAYSQKKGLKSSNFTSVTVIEIDNFSKVNRTFPQEIAQAILKKIAYTISLHEQPIDVIARTDYNQFTIILSRSSKEQTYKDAELIRESISELKFNLADKGNVKITVSGGHVIKPNNTNLEEAIRQAQEILTYAKSIGKNKILQTRDLAHHEL